MMLWPLSKRNFTILCIIGIVGVAFSVAVYLNDSDDLEYSSPELYNFEPAKGDVITFKIVEDGDSFRLEMRITEVSDQSYLSDLTYYDSDGNVTQHDTDVDVDKSFLMADPSDLDDDMEKVADRMRTITTLFGTLTVRHLELRAEDYTYEFIDGTMMKGNIDISYDLYNYHLVKYDLKIVGDSTYEYHSELVSIKKA